MFSSSMDHPLQIINQSVNWIGVGSWPPEGQQFAGELMQRPYDEEEVI